MSRGVGGGIRNRLIAFAVLGAVGILYIAGNFLGLVDAALGRGYRVTASLPASGGLYEGGEVTYRGFKVGEIESMAVSRKGVDLTLALEDHAKVPEGSPMYVHNGSAVGEQYLDFEPKSDDGPYLGEGDRIEGGDYSLPVDEADLLLDLDQLITSVDKKALNVALEELGLMFQGAGGPLQDLLDGGSKFITEARAAQPETIALLRSGLTVLRTQREQGGNIRELFRGLAQITTALRQSDRDFRAVLQGGPGAVREVEKLMLELEPTLPVMLANLVTVNQVVTTRLSAVEQLLITLPIVIASGFTGTPGDGYGHVSLQMSSQTQQACQKGYLHPSRWRRGDDLSDGKIYTKAHCASGPPYNMRGSKYAPKFDDGNARVAPYDPVTGRVGAAGAGRDAERVVIGHQGGLQTVFGQDAWKWMLLGPAVGK